MVPAAETPQPSTKEQDPIMSPKSGLPHEEERTQNAVLALPPNYPPYEDRIDMRLPAHFTHIDQIEKARTCDEYANSRVVRLEARNFFTIGGVEAMIRLSRPKRSPTSNEPAPLFFAIHTAREHLYKWSIVHKEICEIIADNYPDHNPPLVVRWMEEQRVCGF